MSTHEPKHRCPQRRQSGGVVPYALGGLAFVLAAAAGIAAAKPVSESFERAGQNISAELGAALRHIAPSPHPANR